MAQIQSLAREIPNVVGVAIKNKDTDKVYILADFDIVAVNNEGKLYRRIPEILKNKLQEAMECKD